jgi:hypothetical protein
MALLDWLRPARKVVKGKSASGERFRALPANRAVSIPTRPRTEGFHNLVSLGGALYGGFIEPKDVSPERWHPFLRYLRDRIPDVAAGVWAWVRLCSTKRSIEFEGGTPRQREEAQRIVDRLEEGLLESAFDHRPGLDGIVEQFFQSVFTVGAYAGELIATDDRKGIERFYPVDPATIRFKRFPTSGRLTPHQLQEDGDLAALKEESFFYFGLDTDPCNPYGRSPLSSLPIVLRLQQQLFEDMGKAAHNAGYPTLHVKYTAPEREPGESLGDYHDRVQQDFESISTAMKSRAPESNFLTQDNIEIEYVGATGQMLRWRETLETISEQVVAAMHLAPFLIGRNYGTTESWARAQYELMVNNAASVQRAAARLVEWILNLELACKGSPVRGKCYFAPHSAWNDVDEARAQSLRLQTLLKLKEAGLLSEDQLLARVEECR